MDYWNKNLKQISGPVSWTEFLFEDDKGNQKMIHLFGDFHDKLHLCPSTDHCAENKSDEKEKDCYTIIFFLEQLFDEIKSKNQTADFFLEVSYHLDQKEYIEENNQNSLLEDIYQKFKPCFQKDKSKCSYNPNVRMHYTDLRIAFQDKQTLKNLEKSSYGLLGPYLWNQISQWIQSIAGFLNEDNTISLEQINRKTILLTILFNPVLQRYPKIIEIMLASDSGKQELQNYLQPVKDLLSQFEKNLNSKDKKLLEQTLDQLSQLFKTENQSILKRQIDQLNQDQVKINGQTISFYLIQYAMELLGEVQGQNIPQIQNIWKNLKQLFGEWSDAIENFSKIRTKENLQILNQVNINLLGYYQQIEDELQTLILYLDFFVLDLYILARMFRTFGRQPSILSITYAGQDHIRVQSDFLSRLGLKKINDVPMNLERTDFQCLKDNKLGKSFQIPSLKKRKRLEDLKKTVATIRKKQK
jgi:hypothetical protein